MAEKVMKKRTIGKSNRVDVTYTNFAANSERTEIKAKGNDYTNDVLLEMLGFEKDRSGELTLKATSHAIKRDSKGRVTTRTNENGDILTGKNVNIER